jgi:hypothetical protein
MPLLLTKSQIDAGSEAVALTDNKLTADQISDLVSIFRGYLGPLFDLYPVESTLAAEQDTAGSALRCAKLAACLGLFQENQFTPQSGFAATNANRTGFTYSLHGEVYEVFKYAFGLFWTIPAELELQFNALSKRSGGTSSQGVFSHPAVR